MDLCIELINPKDLIGKCGILLNRNIETDEKKSFSSNDAVC